VGGHPAYCYAELAISSPAVAEIIAITHCAYPRRDGQAEQAWLNTKMVYSQTITHPSTNPDCRRLTC